MRRILVCMCLAVILAIAVPGTYAEEADKLKVNETVICDFDDENPSNYYFSQNLDSYAILKEVEGGKVVVFNGVEGKKYEDIRSVLISPDGTKIAYIATIKKKMCVILNGKAGKKYEGILPYSLIFTGDSKYLLYGVTEGDKSFVVTGKKAGKKFDGVSDLTVSEMGSSYAYEARQYEADDWYTSWAVLGKKEYKNYKSPSGMIFSRDGKHFAFSGTSGEKHGMIVDGKRVCDTPTSSVSGDFLFSPDGKSWGLCADYTKRFIDIETNEMHEGPEEHYVIVNGKKDGPFLETGGLVFAEKAKAYACYMKKTEELSLNIYLNGKKYAETQGEDKYVNILISPDGKRIAYSQDGTIYLDKEAIESYDLRFDHFFNSNNKFCQLVMSGGNLLVIEDDKEVASIEGNFGDDLTYNSDCSNFAFVSRLDDTKAIVVGNEIVGEYDAIFYGQQSKFTSDFDSDEDKEEDKMQRKKHRPKGMPDLPDWTTDTDPRHRRNTYVNGIKLTSKSFVFKTDKKIVFFAEKDGKVIKVEVTIP